MLSTDKLNFVKYLNKKVKKLMWNSKEFYIFNKNIGNKLKFFKAMLFLHKGLNSSILLYSLHFINAIKNG